MFYFNTLNLNQISGGSQVKQGDFGSTFTYKLADEKNHELDVFDKKTAYVNLVLDNNIVFTTTVIVEGSTVTFNIDKAIPTGLYFLEIKIDSYIFPSDRQTLILVTAGAVAYDLKELVPNYDTNMTISGILSDLSQKGIDITGLKTKMNAIYNNALADHAEVAKARGSYPDLGSRLDEVDNKQRQTTTQLAETGTGLSQRIDNLTVPLTANNANLEVKDARVSVTKGKTFPTLTHRFEEAEKEISEGFSRRTVFPTYTEGYYINSIGNISTAGGWKYSAPIPLKRFEKIKVNTRGSGTNVSIITKTDATGKDRIPLVTSNNDSVREYVYNAKEDMYVAVSGNMIVGIDINVIHNVSSNIEEINQKINKLETDIQSPVSTSKIETNYTKDKYIGSKGKILGSAGWGYSEPIKVFPQDEISVYTRGSANNVSIITKTNVEGEDRVPLVTSQDSEPHLFTYVAEEEMYVVISGNITSPGIDIQIKNTLYNSVISLSREIDKNKQKLELLEVPKATFDYSVLFSRALFIGDSLTRGFYSGLSPANRSYGYPSAIGQKTNWEITNLGSSGATPSTWYRDFKDNDLSGYDIVFICLGRNKTVSDEINFNAYNDIIAKVRNESPNAVIFIISVPPANDSKEVIANITVKQIAINNNLPYLDITNGLINQENGNIYRPADGIHFNKLGYGTLGLMILEEMNRYISENKDKFVDLYVKE